MASVSPSPTISIERLTVTDSRYVPWRTRIRSPSRASATAEPIVRYIPAPSGPTTRVRPTTIASSRGGTPMGESAVRAALAASVRSASRLATVSSVEGATTISRDSSSVTGKRSSTRYSGAGEGRQASSSRVDLRLQLGLIIRERVAALSLPHRAELAEELEERVGLEGYGDLVELGEAIPDLGHLANRSNEARAHVVSGDRLGSGSLSGDDESDGVGITGRVRRGEGGHHPRASGTIRLVGNEIGVDHFRSLAVEIAQLV